MRIPPYASTAEIGFYFSTLSPLLWTCQAAKIYFTLYLSRMERELRSNYVYSYLENLK